jgi:hypothetical protein
VLTDGVVLYGSMPHLTMLAAPRDRVPMTLVWYRLGKGSSREKVGLHRRLFGYTAASGRKSPGVLQPPGKRIAPGVLLLPLTQRTPVTRALRAAGATFGELRAEVQTEAQLPAQREEPAV